MRIFCGELCVVHVNDKKCFRLDITYVCQVFPFEMLSSPQKQGYFVDVFSSPSQPPYVDVWQISHDPSLSAQLCCSLHTAPR